VLDLVALGSPAPHFGQYLKSFVREGGSIEQMIAFAHQGTVPRVWDYPAYEIHLVDFPQQGVLTAGTLYHFALLAPGLTNVAVQNGSVWTELKKTGAAFAGTARAATGTLALRVKVTVNDKLSYWSLMEYEVR
jgi:hypothetical protein